MLKDASITVRIKPSTRQRIDALASARKRTRSYLVEEALESYLDSDGGLSGGTHEALTVAESPQVEYNALPESMAAPAAGERTIAAKLQVMESLWEELSKTAEGSVAPSWHAEELAARELEVASGRGQFVEWETAREAIRAALK
jgi:predicted transcriptional regulator